jgi:hypothetical protein
VVTILSLRFEVSLYRGLLARLYVEPSGFLLGPEAAFRRIPLGYLGFPALALTVYWLLRRVGVRGVVACVARCYLQNQGAGT